jgi:hypothetical protein
MRPSFFVSRRDASWKVGHIKSPLDMNQFAQTAEFG